MLRKKCRQNSDCPQPVLPLPCNVCISLTSLWRDQHVIDTAVKQWRIRLRACVKEKVSVATTQTFHDIFTDTQLYTQTHRQFEHLSRSYAGRCARSVNHTEVAIGSVHIRTSYGLCPRTAHLATLRSLTPSRLSVLWRLHAYLISGIKHIANTQK